MKRAHSLYSLSIVPSLGQAKASSTLVGSIEILSICNLLLYVVPVYIVSIFMLCKITSVTTSTEYISKCAAVDNKEQGQSIDGAKSVG